MLLVKNWGVVVDVVYRERLLFGSEQLFGACAFIIEVDVQSRERHLNGSA